MGTTRRVASIGVGILALAILLTVSCGSQDVTPKQTSKQGSPRRRAEPATQATRQPAAQQNTAHSTGDPVVAAAGDIASCASNGDQATAHLLARIGGTVLTLGDNAYEDGTAAEFRQCYDPSWGKYKARTRPAPGNHDYSGIDAAEEAGETSIGRAKGYFGYFRKAAGYPSKGYYSHNLGRWHLLSLNSNCAEVDHCVNSSPQMRWLKANLAANHDKRCTLAYFHHSRFSSGRNMAASRK
jgi:hypothetical protein